MVGGGGALDDVIFNPSAAAVAHVFGFAGKLFTAGWGDRFVLLSPTSALSCLSSLSRRVVESLETWIWVSRAFKRRVVSCIEMTRANIIWTRLAGTLTSPFSKLLFDTMCFHSSCIKRFSGRCIVSLAVLAVVGLVMSLPVGIASDLVFNTSNRVLIGSKRLVRVRGGESGGIRGGLRAIEEF